MTVSVVDPIEYPGWNEAIRSLPGHTFFHTSTWAEVLNRSYGYRPVYFTIREGDRISALLPCMDIDSILTGKRGVCLPFTDYCEPLVSAPGQFEELFAAAVAYGKKQNWKTLEIRGGACFLKTSIPGTVYLTDDETADLSSIIKYTVPEIQIRDSTRRNIRKAEKEGVTASVAVSPEAMEEFCRLNAMTRRDHGLPPQPRRFFRHVCDHILSKNMGFIVLASWHGAVIAANVYFCFGDQVIYKYGASDKAYQHLRANNLVMWEAIKHASGLGCKTLCLGRTEPENKGLRQFKAGWGIPESTIHYYRYDLRKDAFVKAQSVVSPFSKKLFNKLPLPVLKSLGAILYRHMG